MDEKVNLTPRTDRGELVVVDYSGEPNVTAALQIANEFMERRHGADWDENWMVVGANVDRPRKPCRLCGRAFEPDKVVEIMYVRGTHLNPEDIAERRREEAAHA